MIFIDAFQPIMNPNDRPSLKAVADFTIDYVSQMLGSGASTLRVNRCTRRLTDSLDVDVEMLSTSRHLTITCRDRATGEFCTRVVSVPQLPINFERTTGLSTLSWEAHDGHYTLRELRRKFEEILSKPRLDFSVTLMLISVANACFCHLFGGDLMAMGFVFMATMIGFSIRQVMTGWHINVYLVYVTSAFIASLVASVSLLFDCTAATAIATSPLYLVPGVPLINGIIDIVEGHIQVGISRLVTGMMLILCIAIGLSATLEIVKGSLL